MIPLSRQFRSVVIHSAVICLLLVTGFSCRRESIIVPDQNRPHQEIPLFIAYNPPGGINLVTPHVHIFVNNIPCDVLFDTGSEGLRLMAGAINGAVPDTDSEVITASYGFSSGQLYIRGGAAGGSFSLGRGFPAIPLKFMRIQDTAVGSAGPWVSVASIARFDNAHFRGLNGVMGVGLRPSNSGIVSPLAQLPGSASYIVEFPPFHDTVGRVILNPCTADLAGFTMFPVPPDSPLLPNGIASWNDFAMNGTLVLNGTTIPLPTLLDTGSPYTEVFYAGKAYTPVPVGMHVQMELAVAAGGTPVVFNDFTVSGQVVGIDYVTLFKDTFDAPHMSFGTNLFFAYDVFFDQQNGRIGLRKKQL